MNKTNNNSNNIIDVWIVQAPHWVALFIFLSVAISVVPFFVGFLVGVSVSSDIVFGVYALISGLVADFLLRWKLQRALVIWQRPRVPFSAFWICLCLYVIIFQPLG